MKKVVLICNVLSVMLFLAYGLGFAQCYGDFNCDGGVDGGDLSKFAISFGENNCSGDLYVDVTIGQDAPSNGSADKPFKTISYALSKSSCCCGSTIHIAPGTYNENPTIDKDNIALKKKDGSTGDVIIDGGGQDVITIDAAQKVAIRGVIVQNGTDGISGKRGSAFEVSGTTVQDCTDEGIQVNENSTARILDSTVERSGDHGIGVFRSDIFLNGNMFCNNNSGHGIAITNNSNAFITGALTSNNNRRGIFVWNSSSLETFGSTITTNNNRRGILIANASSLSASDSTMTFLNNLRWGLHLVGTSSIYTDPDTSMTIRNSDRGFQVGSMSYAEITGSLSVENSGNWGIFANINSGIYIDDPARVTVSNTAGDGVGILIVENSFVNAQGGLLTVEDNDGSGIVATRSSGFMTGTEISINIRNNGGRGILADDGSTVNCNNATITGNTGGDVLLSFGSRATLNGNTIGSLPISCDGTALSRGDHVCP